MPADLYIHVMKDVDEKDLALFFCNALGSKYFARSNPPAAAREAAQGRVCGTPKVRVGEVSWLAAVLSEDDEDAGSFLPGPVVLVDDLIGEDLPIIDDALISKVTAAMESENTTGYVMGEKEGIVAFLEKWRGHRVFTVSW